MLVVHALNVNHAEMQGVAQHMLSTITGQLHGSDETTINTEVH